MEIDLVTEEDMYMKRKYYYDIPTFNADNDGNIIIIHKYSMAPIETKVHTDIKRLKNIK